jgi:taurine transport system substrate-binding protein
MVYMHKVVKDSECLVVRNDAGIKELKDLKGKKIGCPFNTSAHFGILSAMKIAGLGAADVTLVNLRPDAIPAAWQRKEIDGAYIWHPVLLSLERSGGPRHVQEAAPGPSVGLPERDRSHQHRLPHQA